MPRPTYWFFSRNTAAPICSISSRHYSSYSPVAVSPRILVHRGPTSTYVEVSWWEPLPRVRLLVAAVLRPAASHRAFPFATTSSSSSTSTRVSFGRPTASALGPSRLHRIAPSTRHAHHLFLYEKDRNFRSSENDCSI